MHYYRTPGMSGISIFFLLLLIFTIIYFVGGALLMYFMRGARGIEMIPNVDFWRSLPTRLKVNVKINLVLTKFILILVSEWFNIRLKRLSTNLYKYWRNIWQNLSLWKIFNLHWLELCIIFNIFSFLYIIQISKILVLLVV